METTGYKAFELRQTSDYKTFKLIPKERAQDTLSDAVYFVNAIMKYLEDDMEKS